MEVRKTKQGVRDLDQIHRPKKKRVELPPAGVFECTKHRFVEMDSLSGDKRCSECGQVADWTGRPLRV